MSWEPFALSAAILARQKADKTGAIQNILRTLFDAFISELSALDNFPRSEKQK